MVSNYWKWFYCAAEAVGKGGDMVGIEVLVNDVSKVVVYVIFFLIGVLAVLGAGFLLVCVSVDMYAEAKRKIAKTDKWKKLVFLASCLYGDVKRKITEIAVRRRKKS